MYVETITITRPDTTMDFWHFSGNEPPEWQALIDEAIRRGQILSFTDNEPFGDQLTYVRIFKFPTEAEHTLLRSEFSDLIPEAVLNRKTYEATNGHIRTYVYTTEPEQVFFDTQIRRRPTPAAKTKPK